MKKAVITSLMFCGVLVSGPICNFKAQDIQNQIDEATSHNRIQEIRGLKKALKELVDHCGDDVELAKIQSEIKKIEFKISKADQELLEVKEKGKVSKIKKEEKKIEILKIELLEKKEELSRMQKLSNK